MFKALVGSFLLLASANTWAASETVLRLDETLIATRQQHAPELFALPLAVDADLAHDGEWQLQGETMQWHHDIVVAGAKALALEAEVLQLPAGATLTIGNQSWQGPQTLHHVFTHHQPGTRLQLSATMPRALSSGFVLRVVAVQAAFRNPYQAATAVTAKAGSSCSVNFACAATGAVQQWGGSVVAIVVLNSATCTGTLMNNSSGDGRPYLLTAKHCYTSTGGTDPARAAASLRVAWNAVASCGAALVSAWSSGTPITEGATHRAEYGDTWLVELKNRPSEALAPWYAGFDAGDQIPAGQLVGLHNGQGLQRQLLSTSSLPRLTRVAGFLGGIDLLGWGFNPQQGGAEAGSSGSGLFDPQGHLIGTLSTGSSCDLGAPQVTYARLSQAWSGDGTSSGSLRPWLDPLGSGTAVMGKSFTSASLPTAPAPVQTPAAGAASEGGGGGAMGASLLLLLAAMLRRKSLKTLAGG